MNLDEHQQKAFDAVLSWHRLREKQTFSVGGYAGSGKTTLIRHLIEHFESVVVCAFTGKAVYVLDQKGVEAVTLHRLLYDYIQKDTDGQPVFEPKPVGALADFDLVIVDEASMVSRPLAQTLLQHGVPVLWVGDHGQLEPIGSGSVSLVKEPDIVLEHIHRQAETSGIISFAHHVRQEQNPYTWDQREFQDVSVCEPDFFGEEQLHTYDVLIVGTNKQRIKFNQLIRKQRGFGSATWDAEALSRFEQDNAARVTFGMEPHALPLVVPQPGEPLLILRNSYRHGVFNGQVVSIQKPVVPDIDSGVFWICFSDGVLERTAPFSMAQFNEPELLLEEPYDYLLADFGYALTGYKAQASEWERVAVLEERRFSDVRWRYTAATRASKTLCYVPWDKNWTKAKLSDGLIGKMASRPKSPLLQKQVRDPAKAAAFLERMKKRVATR